MKRAVLTGASGFIGRAAAARLVERGFEIHSLGRGEPSPGCIPHTIDLVTVDPAPLLSTIEPTHLLHLAWYAEPGRFWNALENLDWVAASLRLVRGFAAAGGRRVVAAGTCAEYDWSYSCLDEARTPLVPASLYGETKASLYRILMKAAPALGLSIGWGRIFFPYGPGERPGRLLSGLLDGIARGERIDFSAGNQQRDFIHVDDVATAFALLLDSELEGAVNIASGEIVSVRALVEHAARLSGGEGFVSFGSRPMQPGEPTVMMASVERLTRELGFTPRHDLDSGLRDTIERRSAPPSEKDEECA